MKLEDYLKPDASGSTPLHEAVAKGHLDQIATDFKDSGGKFSLCHLLIKNKDDGEIPLHVAAGFGYLHRVRKILRASGEKLTVDHFLIPDNEGWTALHWAARNGHLDQVMTVLKPSGEKLSLTHFLTEDKNGQSPLGRAVEKRHLQQIFVPSYWQGRAGEMIELWAHVPPKKQATAGFDFPSVVNEIIQQSVQAIPKINPETFLHATRATPSSPDYSQKATEQLP